jgi:galactokinase
MLVALQLTTLFVPLRARFASRRSSQAEGVLPTSAASAYFVPGRIEVVGKHTDYAGGRSLLAATSKVCKSW